MAYLRPAKFARIVFNRVAMRLHLAGTATLTVPGRTSGSLRRVPVIAVEVDGTRYLVSTRGESEWVRNLRLAGGGTLETRRASERIRASEVAVADRPPILSEYQKKAGRFVKTYFAKLPDPSDHPVFRVDPLTG